jgi:hypothetical protein
MLMLLLLTISHHTSVRIAEVAFLLILIAGIWMVAAELLPPRLQKSRMVVAGIAFAAAGLLLVIVTHWGHFG